MYKAITAVALRTVKYGESRSILTVWSAQEGRLSLLMPAGTGAESRRRRALTMPLCLFEAAVDVRPDRDIFTARDVRAHRVLPQLATNPMKVMIAQFLAEVLDVSLREGGVPDPLLWQFLRDSVIALDSMAARQAINFHLNFLVRYATMLGIEPDGGGYTRGDVFDMIDGMFRATPPSHGRYIDSHGARLAHIIINADGDVISRMALSRADRARLLDVILDYYALHHVDLTRLHTLAILRQL